MTEKPPGIPLMTDMHLSRVRMRYMTALDKYTDRETVLESLADIPDLFLAIDQERGIVRMLQNEIQRLAPSDSGNINDRARKAQRRKSVAKEREEGFAVGY